MVNDLKLIWSDVLETIKVSVSPAIFSTWFSQTHLADLKENKGRFLAEIGCHSSFAKNTIETRYFGLIQDTLSRVLGKPCDLTFSIKENIDKVKKETTSAPLFEVVQNEEEKYLKAISQAKLRIGYTFSNFAVSSSNQMAYAAAEAVAENPGKAYNPLFIWGGVGVGKTHLMIAIGHSIIKKNTSAKILFCTGEDFTNDIVEGIRNKNTPEVRRKYRKLDVLLIDDVQFIAGKETAQEEFFHTFNAVTGAGGQIVLISDKPPSEMSKLEERLRSRFEAGLIVDIAPPDFELRCAITQIKAKEKGIKLEMEAVQLIAANLDSARKIEGFLIKLISAARMRKTEITIEFIESLLSKSSVENGRLIKAKPQEVIDAVAKYFSLGKRVLLGESRKRSIARPRQILMYLLRTHLGLPLEEVGRLINGRDHTTVMHAVEKITHLASSDVQIRKDILGIKNSL